MRKWIYLSLSAAIVLVPAAAQEPKPRTMQRQTVVLESFERAGPGPGVTFAGGQDVLMHVISPEFSWQAKVVKGAPYSADALTETQQTLADGNRIYRKSASKIWRDSEGRERREQTFTGFGPVPASFPHRAVFINDPVAGLNYILEAETKTARKIAVPKNTSGADTILFHGSTIPVAGSAVGQRIEIRRESGAAMARQPMPGSASEARIEPLGTRNIEGVMAEGTRTVTTIPAGAVGNERPIEIVSERWYSNELQTVVMTRHIDPRMGETVYRLANVQRSEPDHALFVPPADYTVQEMGNMRMRSTERKEHPEL